MGAVRGHGDFRFRSGPAPGRRRTTQLPAQRGRRLSGQRHPPVSTGGLAGKATACLAIGLSPAVVGGTGYRRDPQILGVFNASCYCWSVRSLANLRLAPFQLLAAEAAVFVERDHLWQMRMLARLAECQPRDANVLMATRHQLVELGHAASEAQAIAWWEDLTAAGGEGMVVKPVAAVVSVPRSLIQPALKCRGREYLRMGPIFETGPVSIV